jgi:hypothetical protein
MKVFAGLYYASMVNTYGFALLLEDGVLHSVLTAVRPDGQTNGDDVPFPGGDLFPEPSPGVVVTKTTSPGPHFTLGGHTYNDPNAVVTSNTTCGGGPCLTDVTSTVTPGAGTYQLLFGAFGGLGWTTMGIAVTEVTVPEVNLLVLLSLGVAVLVLIRRRALHG